MSTEAGYPLPIIGLDGITGIRNHSNPCLQDCQFFDPSTGHCFFAQSDFIGKPLFEALSSCFNFRIPFDAKSPAECSCTAGIRLG